MSSFRRTTPCWLIVQALCFCLLLQGSGIAQALPLPPKRTLVSPEELASARFHRAETPVEPGLLKRLADDTLATAEASIEHVRGWLEDVWAPASSAAGHAAPLRIAQAGGTLPLPARLMPAVFAAPLQGGPPGPPSRAGAETEATPPAEAARLLEKAGTDQIPLVAGWNLISIPLELADPDPAAVFAPIAGQLARVEHNDVCDRDDPWKIYVPGDPAASDLTAISPGMGLWVKVTAASLLPIEGTLPATTTIELCPGWNHIAMPTGEPRHPQVALSSVAGKWQRVYGHDAFDAKSPWEVFDPAIPSWYNDLLAMRPGYGYWVLASEAVTLTISNQGPPPTVALAAPADLAVVTQPSQVTGTVDSDRLESWALTATPKDDGEPVTLASGTAPVSGPGVLATFDPTLLLNGLYQLELTATDVQGQQVSESVSVTVEGQMKIGHFTLSFVDLAIPVSGLAIEILRTYESRDQQQRDFGVGWRLDVRQGSYVNNRLPGDGWQLQTGFLPCDTVVESKSHLTVVRLSDQEVYRFALKLQDGAPTGGGCFAAARFDYVDGPLPGSTLEILGGTQVFWENGSNQVIDADSFELYEPQDVKLTTRDGRIFELDLNDGVTKLEDLNGNQLTITPTSISHSSGEAIAMDRDAEGRILRIADPSGAALDYAYDAAGDLITVTDRADATTRFVYYGDHRIVDITDPLGQSPIRNEADGRLIKHIDASGKTVDLAHDVEGRQEIITDRLGRSRILTYDARGNVVSEIDELGNQILRTFDERDNPLSVRDPLGNTVMRTYSAANDLLSETDELGNTTTFTHDGAGRILTMRDPRGAETTNVYDARGNVLQTTDAEGHTTTFTYEAQGNVLTIVDPLGQTSTSTYDARGRLVEQVDAGGHVTAFAYDSRGLQTRETRTRTLADGSVETLVTELAYDAEGQLTATIAADGTQQTYGYDLLGRVTSQTDQLGRVTRFTYDPQGRLTTTTYPDGTQESRILDAEGRMLSSTDRAGRATAFAYDALGRLQSLTLPDGATVTHTYDAAGRRVATIDARGNTTAFSYDAAGQLIVVTDALGNTTSATYDEAGNRVTTTDALGNSTTFAYDLLSQQTGTTFADGTSVSTVYDALGRAISQTDPLGRQTVFAFDPMGRLTTVTDALEQETSFIYDEIGNLVSQTDANGHTTRFTYDRLGRRTSRILPDGAVERFEYSADGNLARQISFSGAVTELTYDLTGRLLSRSHSGGSAVTFTYTPTGKRASYTDARGTTAFSYDARDRLTSMITPGGRRLDYAYDLMGNRISLTATIGAANWTTSYAFDAANRLVSVTDANGGVYTHGYDGNSNRTLLEYPNGVRTTTRYDALNRLTELTTATSVGGAIQSYSFALDAAGRRSHIDEADGTRRSYSHDPLGRLLEDRVTDGAGDLVYRQAFSYDPVGNRLSRIDEDATGNVADSASSYDARDRLLSQGGVSFAYDTGGRLVSRTGSDAATLTWDTEERLRRVDLAGGRLVETLYDPDGHRVRTVTTAPDGEVSTVDYLVDPTGGLSHVVAESTGGNLLALYVRGDELLAVLRPGAGEERYYHADGLGSIRRLTDAAETVTDSYTFSAFGELIQRTGTDPQPYLFTSEPFDRNLGFAYHRARWLDPGAGRFLSMDLFAGFAEDPISLHRYLYASADPANLVDPTGEYYLASLSLSQSWSNLRVAAANVALRVYVRVQYLLLVSPLALPLIAKLSNIATLGLSATILLNQMATALLTNTEIPPTKVGGGEKSLGVWVERRANVNLGESFPGIDHWDDDNRMGVQLKARTTTDPVTLAREIEKDARKLAKAGRIKALEGTSNSGRFERILPGRMRIRVLDVYIKEAAANVLRDPRFLNKVRAVQRTTGVFIRVIPVRRLR